MNKAQEYAIAKFRRHLEGELKNLDGSVPYGGQVTKFEVTPTDYGTFWISADTELTGLPENNLLRALEHNHWCVSIGKRGAIVVHSSPRSYHQFNNKRAFDMVFTLGSVNLIRKQVERERAKAEKEALA
jgi:hypothetical protein